MPHINEDDLKKQIDKSLLVEDQRQRQCAAAQSGESEVNPGLQN